MHRIETTRDPIDEAAPRARGAIHDLQILPAERDRPRPLDGLAPQLPATVVEPLDRPPDRPARRGGPVGTDEVARERSCRGAPARDFRNPRRPERPSGHEQTKGLEEVRFPLAVRAKGKRTRSEEHTSELQSRLHLVCRLLL